VASQRSTREVSHALVLPVDGSVQADALETERRSIITLWTPDTLLVIPEGVHGEAELQRTWQEAAHHIDLARRRGEDAAGREELFEPPDALLGELNAFGTIVEDVAP